MTETPTAPAGQTPRQIAVNKGYTAASKRLREIHLDEFNALRVEETKKLGFDWEPPLTDRQKAKADLDKILQAHPDLLSETVHDKGAPLEFNTTPEDAGL